MKPLLKDEKIRKAVKSWYDAWKNLVGEREISVIKYSAISMDLTLDSTAVSIHLPLNETLCFPALSLGRTDAVYTIEELCGEEEE